MGDWLPSGFPSASPAHAGQWGRGEGQWQPGGHWGLCAGRKAVSTINNLFLDATQEGVVMATGGLPPGWPASCPSELPPPHAAPLPLPGTSRSLRVSGAFLLSGAHDSCSSSVPTPVWPQEGDPGPSLSPFPPPRGHLTGSPAARPPACVPGLGVRTACLSLDISRHVARAVLSRAVSEASVPGPSAPAGQLGRAFPCLRPRGSRPGLCPRGPSVLVPSPGLGGRAAARSVQPTGRFSLRSVRSAPGTARGTREVEGAPGSGGWRAGPCAVPAARWLCGSQSCPETSQLVAVSRTQLGALLPRFTGRHS